MGFGTDDEIATTRLDLAEKALGADVDVKLVKGEGSTSSSSGVRRQRGRALADLRRPQPDRDVRVAGRGHPRSRTASTASRSTPVSIASPPSTVTFDDQVYGIPEFNVVPIVQADKTLLDSAGVTVDDVNGSDWDAIARANKEIARQEGGKVSVIGYDSKLPEFLPLWVHANGGALISDDGRTPQLDSPEVVEALEFAVGIYDDQGASVR